MDFKCHGPVLINKDTLENNRIYLQNKYSQPNESEQKAQQAKQNIINSFPALLNSFCANPMPALLASTNLNASEVQEISKYKNDEKCLVNALTSSSYLAQRLVGSIPANLFLDDFGRVGKASVFGNVIKFDYHNPNGTNISLPLLVKTSKEINDITLKNEALIGYYLNFLRLYVPNFVYTLGVTQCAPAIVDDQGQVKSFCDATGDQPYIIIEKVEQPITVKDYLSDVNTTFEDWFNVFNQVLIALYHSQALDFTHYDLHYENVLLSKNDPVNTTSFNNNFNSSNNNVKQYLVNTPFGPRYVQYTHLAKIIDFGYGHATIPFNNGNIFYGQYNPKYNVFADKSFLLYDVYKLLMFSLHEVTASSRTDQQKITFLTKVWPLYKYFNYSANNFDDLLNDIDYGSSNSFTLFTTEPERAGLNFDSFMQCLYSTYQDYWNKYLPSVKQPGVALYQFDELSPDYDLWSAVVNQNIVQNYAIHNYRQALYLQRLATSPNVGPEYRQIINQNINNFINSNWLSGGMDDNFKQLTMDINNIGVKMDTFTNNYIGINIDYELNVVEKVGLDFVDILHQTQRIFQRYVDFMQFNTIIIDTGFNISMDLKEQLAYLRNYACSYYQYFYNAFLQNVPNQQYLVTFDNKTHQMFNARYTFEQLMNIIDNTRNSITEAELKRKYNVVGRLMDNIVQLIDDTLKTGGNSLVCQV